ncbi:hypothetical protein QJS10_CPA06g01143 [Acorus calamus]|uniref:Aminotransferase-like plant mobile domain-containing protein n=1 Tax=Acorus calamus TaxID=4465 RepID=A0AAV9EIM7_ACOCL|nr:hypothetical protein QJS10_CPA06g01143 [Acorus calamus]
MIEAREAVACPQRAQRELRVFFLYFFGRVLFSTASHKVFSHSLLLMRDLEGMGRYAWGVAMLVHLFAELSKKVKRAGGKNLGGFAPFLQIFGYEHFAIDRPTLAPFDHALPWAMRWEPRGSSRLHRLAQFREALRVLSEEEMTWRPYSGEVPEALARDVWLIYFNEVVFHEISRVVRQLGYHQWVPDSLPWRPSIPVAGIPRDTNLPRNYATYVAGWMGRGVLVERRPEVTSSDEYLAWYRREYAGILGTMEEEIPDAYVELNEMEKRLKAANEHLQARARQIEALWVQRGRLEDQVRVLEAQVDALSRARADGASSSSIPPSSMISERELELTRKLDVARSELTATRMELGQARGMASRAEEETDRLRSMVASREERFITLGRERDSLQMRVSELEASASVPGGLMGDLVRSLQAAGDRDREALRASEARAWELEEKLRAAEDRARGTESRLRQRLERRDRVMQQVRIWEATMRGKLVGGGSMTEADLDLLPLEPDHSLSAFLATGSTFSRTSRPSASRSRGIYARAASSVRETPAAPDAPEVQSSPHPPPPSQPSQDVPPTQPPADDDTPR